MPKEPSIAVRFELATREALFKAAAEQERSVSSLVRLASVEWLRHQGYLPTARAERLGELVNDLDKMHPKV